MNLYFSGGGSLDGEVKVQDHYGPEIWQPVWTAEYGMCRDAYRVSHVSQGALHYVFADRAQLPVSCVDPDCETCAEDPSLREWKQVPVDE